MPPPEPGEALDVVRRLEAELVALERSFAALDAHGSHQQTETESRAPDPRNDVPAPLTPDEHRRLKRHLEALLEEVRQLADFLEDDGSGPCPPKPG